MKGVGKVTIVSIWTEAFAAGSITTNRVTGWQLLAGKDNTIQGRDWYRMLYLVDMRGF